MFDIFSAAEVLAAVACGPKMYTYRGTCLAYFARDGPRFYPRIWAVAALAVGSVFYDAPTVGAQKLFRRWNRAVALAAAEVVRGPFCISAEVCLAAYVSGVGATAIRRR